MKMTRHSAIAFGLLSWLLMPIAPAQAADLVSTIGRKASWCGTWDWGIELALAKHDLNRRQLEREFRAQSGGTGSFETVALQIEQDGHVAVIRDDGSLIVEENSFDYQDRGLKFVRRGQNGYKFRNLGKSINTVLGEKLNLGDDDATRVDLPGFEITYYGERYSSLFVNSDGNWTFGKADTASTSRDIQRLLNGQPRVAPFFADLDPSAATGDGGVYLRFAGSKIVVTWWQVPEFGKTNRNTFQVSMNPRGNVEVLFGEMMAREGIVGVAPGGGSGLELVDLSEDLPIKRKGVAMVERFSEDESLDEAAVAAAFYQNYADDYDQLVLFTDFGVRAQDSAIAYHITVKNSVRGIGKSVYDGSRFFGSNGRLGGFINMGGQIQYSSDVTRPSFWDTYSATDILAHELGHQWLVSATFVESQGRQSDALLGRDNAHWNFYFDSDLSFMEGNEIRDDGNGQFTTLARRATYNPFDRYLMGLIPADQVPDKFYVELTGDGPDADVVPVQPGETVTGNRVDVSIDQIIASLGTRSPSVEASQKLYRVGLIVLAKQGQQPSQSTIDKVNRIAVEIEKLFHKETGRLGSVDTTLVGR
jgi:hypothetical protein